MLATCGRFHGIHTLDFPFSYRNQISLTMCLMYFGESFSPYNQEKAFEKIAKLKLGKYWVGCLCPI